MSKFFLMLLFLLCLSSALITQGQDCKTPRLQVNGQGIVGPGSANRIRSQPNTSGEQIGSIPAGAIFDVLEGPQCGEGYLWWRVSYNNVTGWTVEASSSDYFVDPVSPQATAAPTLTPDNSCSQTPKLKINGLGRITSNTPSRIRNSAGSSNQLVGQIDPIDTFSVLDGPLCVEGYNWWQVKVNSITGWVAEGSGSEYFIELMADTPTPTVTRTPSPTYTFTPSRTPTITNTPTITYTPSNTPTATPTGFSQAFTLSWNADGTRLALGTSEGVFIYNAEDWSELPRLLTDETTDVLAFSPVDPNLLVVNSRDNNFSFRSYELGDDSDEILFEYSVSDADTLKSGGVWKRDMSFSDDGSLFAFDDVNIYVFDTNDWKQVDGLKARDFDATHKNRIFPIDMSPDGKSLLNIVNFTSVQIHSFTDDSNQVFDRDILEEQIASASFSPNGEMIAIGDVVGDIQMWDVETGQRTSFVRNIAEGNSQSNHINTIAFNPDGTVIASAESDPQGIVRFFRADDLHQLSSYGLKTSALAAIDLAYSPDGSWLAVIMDNYVHVLETENYTLKQILIQHP